MLKADNNTFSASPFTEEDLNALRLQGDPLADEVIERHRERANEKKIALISKYSPEKMLTEADRTRTRPAQRPS